MLLIFCSDNPSRSSDILAQRKSDSEITPMQAFRGFLRSNYCNLHLGSKFLDPSETNSVHPGWPRPTTESYKGGRSNGNNQGWRLSIQEIAQQHQSEDPTEEPLICSPTAMSLWGLRRDLTAADGQKRAHFCLPSLAKRGLKRAQRNSQGTIVLITGRRTRKQVLVKTVTPKCLGGPPVITINLMPPGFTLILHLVAQNS
ncbi:hypothetical protein TNCV_124371 [Trichonephila clavipes]|nr:hypothetical protein TNCV_124371 [Trichonephila clavipes]